MRFLALIVLAIYGNTVAAPLEFSSGKRQVSVVELFTSEGCSSCPPAERWLNTLKNETNLWSEFIPVAFHVDYWDYIGWEDSFAKPAFNARQHQYAAEGGTRFVYTPGMFRNGSEWVGWRSGEEPVGARITAAPLSLWLDGDKVRASFEAQFDGPLNISVAILGMDLETRVRAGENRGRTLRHDFVALTLVTRPLVDSDGHYAAELTVSTPETDAKRLAIVAWVSKPNGQMPLQATGGYIDKL